MSTPAHDQEEPERHERTHDPDGWEYCFFCKEDWPCHGYVHADHGVTHDLVALADAVAKSVLRGAAAPAPTPETGT